MAASRTPRGALIVLGAAVVVLLLLHVNVGSYAWYTPWRILREVLAGPSDSAASVTVWQLRLPRALECLCVGGILGIVGSAFQAQFRNPLADPYIVGVSSGAAIGGVAAVLLGLTFSGLGTLLFGFAGGMLSLGLVVGLSRRRGVIDVTSLLLSGVVIGAMLSSLMSLTLLAAGNDTNRVLGWLLGSMDRALWNQVAVLAAVLLLGFAVLVRETRRLNALALGEETAARLGVDVGRLRTIVLTVGTAMTAAAVGAVGIVGFLGLVAPHIARRVVGVDWRWSLAGSGLVGSGLMLAADLLASRGMAFITRTVGMEVPVGIVTAVLGAPALLWLLRRQRSD